jgi:hypothetical protein
MSPIVMNEYLLCLPLSDQLWLPNRQKGRGLLSGCSALGITGCHLQPKILDMTGSLMRQMAAEPYTHTRCGPTTPG